MVDGDGEERSEDDRLRDLERSEVRRREGERLDRRFELIEAIVLSVAAVLAAWAGFQASAWSGQQADAYNRANAAHLDSVAAGERADQERSVDVTLFTEWLAALEREGAFDQPPTGEVYEPDPTVLSGFLYERFRDEFQPAVQAWVATRPRTTPDAPPTPFAMAEYQLAAEREAAELRAQADEETSEARVANDRSDRYVLMTIVLATVLFFAGISSKLDTARARAILLTSGVLLLVGSAAVVAFLPRHV